MDDYQMFEIKPNSSIIEHFNNHPTCIDKEFNFILQKTELRSIESNPDRFKTALLDKNKTKNRYSNVLPFEDTRVKLHIDDTDYDEDDDPEEATDYINASFLNNGGYICTQGPLLNTINDFWKMIWEQSSNVIVMLTKEEENHKVKCDKYWPDEGQIQCGRYTIKFENKISIPEISIRREFTLTDTKTAQSKSIKHFQYMSWPDHSTPASTTNFLKFIGHVDNEVRTGPITVHCSAGIGRSGTFCVIHSVVSNYIKEYEEKKQPPSLNLPKTVVEFRNERAGMVQTREQYRFCYLAISETMNATIKKDQRKRKGLSYSYSSIPITPSHNDNDNVTTTAFQ